MGLREDIAARTMEKMAAISDYVPDDFGQVYDALGMTADDIVGGLDSVGSTAIDAYKDLIPQLDFSGSLSGGVDQGVLDNIAGQQDHQARQMHERTQNRLQNAGKLSLRDSEPDLGRMLSEINGYRPAPRKDVADLVQKGEAPDLGRMLSEIQGPRSAQRAKDDMQLSYGQRVPEALGNGVDSLESGARSGLKSLGDAAERGYAALDDLKGRAGVAIDNKSQQVKDLIDRVYGDMQRGYNDSVENTFKPMGNAIKDKLNAAGDYIGQKKDQVMAPINGALDYLNLSKRLQDALDKSEARQGRRVSR